MEQGDTFLLEQVALGTHLWAVLSRPREHDGKVLMVSFTTHRPYHDQSCVVDAGDHPFITRRSCVNYDGTKLYDEAFVVQYGQPREPLTAALLERVIAGAANSERIELGHLQILLDQGLI